MKGAWEAYSIRGIITFEPWVIDYGMLYKFCLEATQTWPDRSQMRVFFQVEAKLTRHFLPEKVKARLLDPLPQSRTQAI